MYEDITPLLHIPSGVWFFIKHRCKVLEPIHKKHFTDFLFLNLTYKVSNSLAIHLKQKCGCLRWSYLLIVSDP